MKKGLGKLMVYAAAIVITVLGLMIANNRIDRVIILDQISEWSELQKNDFSRKKI